MNAPQAPGPVLELNAELVPVDVICPSDTHLQQMRRKRFSDEGLLELAVNLKATAGVLQPILLRPFPPTRDYVKSKSGLTPKYEIVAGERRWLATQRAGFAHIAAVIRDVEDGDVLLAQMSENKQRDDYTPLEEAAGYTDLKEIKKWDAQEIADHVGKSKSYVYARLKLGTLSPDARAALETGKLDYSKALLLARVQSPKLQEKALQVLTAERWNGDSVSYREAFETLREKFMIPLGTAPFAMDEVLTEARKAGGKHGQETLGVPLPICTACPHNSANDAELQRDLKSDAHVCTNTDCFDLKVIAFHARRRQQAEAENLPVITGEDAKKIFPRKAKIVGYVDLDEPCDSDQFDEDEPEATSDEDFDTPAFQAKISAWEDRSRAWQPRTYRQLLGEHKLEVKLAEDPKTKKIRELVPFKAARELLAKKHKIAVPAYIGQADRTSSGGSSNFDHDAWQKKQDEQRARQEREDEWRLAVAKAIAEKCAGPLTREDLVDVADALADDWGAKNALRNIYGKTPEPGQLKDPELGKFIRLALIGQEMRQGPGPLLVMAKRYKVDATKIRADLDAKRKAAEKPKADAPAKKVPAKKKPAAKKK